MASKYCNKTKSCKNSCWCAADKDFGENCEWYDQLTNGDRIRSMSESELAEGINRVESDARYYGPKGKAVWLNWLQQEVDK